MKERFVPQAELTKAGAGTYSRSMPGEPGGGEQSSPQTDRGREVVARVVPQDIPERTVREDAHARTVPPERRQQVSEAWASLYKRQGQDIDSLSVDERRTINRLTEAGVFPMSGGAPGIIDPVPEGVWGVANLEDIAQDFNRLVANNRARASDIKEMVHRVQDMLDKNIITNTAERARANDLTQLLIDRSWEQEQEEITVQQEAGQRAQRRRELTQEEAEALDNFNAAVTPEDKTHQLMEIVRQASRQQIMQPRIIDTVINHIGTSQEPFMYMVNRIIGTPLDMETSDYRLEFHEQNNFTAIRQALRTYTEDATVPLDEKRQREALYQKFVLLSEAVKYGHEMNKQIVTGDIESFIRISRVITPAQLQVLQDVRGVGTVMRLFEQEYMRIVAREGGITEATYEEIVGKSRERQTGETVEERKQGTVEKLFNEMIHDPTNPQHYEDWEERWAFNIGKIMFNAMVRSGEHVSLSKPLGSTDKSIPQENMARLLNQIQWISKRFAVGEARGGVKYIDMVIEAYQHLRGEQGYGHTNLTNLSNRTIAEYEYPSMFGISGVYSGWRQNEILLKQSPYAEGTMSIFDYLGREGAALRTPEGLRQTFLSENGELREEFSNALGIVLKHGSISPSAEDSEEMQEEKARVRTAIWRRVARDNPIVMAAMLDGMQFIENDTLNDNLNELSTYFKSDKEGDPWHILKNKLIRANERRMELVNQGQIATLEEVIGDFYLTPSEQEMLQRIQSLGVQVAGDLAAVRFPFTPFINDVLLENARYANAGAEFYRRRLGGDLPQFNAAYGKLAELMGNPGGMDSHKALEALLGMVEAMGGVLGIKGAQEKIEPFVEARLEFLDETGRVIGDDEKTKSYHDTRSGFVKWLSKQSLLTGLMHTAGKPTSLAQKFAGLAAPADREEDTDKELKLALHMGVINEDQYQKYRTKLNLKLGWLLAAFFRDLLPLFVASMFVETGKSVAKEK